MDEPIVSIYDMLMKRYRQQRREDLQGQKDSLLNRPARDIRLSCAAQLQSHTTSQSSMDKKTRLRLTRPRSTMDNMSSCKMSTNVTATHLTKKQSGVLLQPPIKKEVLNHLVAKMSGLNRKQMVGAAVATSASDKPTSSLSKKRSKNVKAMKSSHGSGEFSKSRNRLVLSPRHTNRQLKPQIKRDKLKVNSELKQLQQQQQHQQQQLEQLELHQQQQLQKQQQRRLKNADSAQQKHRVRTRISKISVTVKEASVEKATRHRL
ncbi:hairy/enhancer-of-split related with YRPW motif protein [Drosophila hydei]|uniref:Hairy/enhancer-of-split related with YRPW motif protein n=1 Tax=Drosophila hydei TaxID=7224 RepID=A0A6J1M287_DROHY|nr:hairy/enhancer-of-split related with YRPW motif protein [Drosophila hydei]